MLNYCKLLDPWLIQNKQTKPHKVPSDKEQVLKISSTEKKVLKVYLVFHHWFPIVIQTSRFLYFTLRSLNSFLLCELF